MKILMAIKLKEKRKKIAMPRVGHIRTLAGGRVHDS
jgi:hypothetical protein